MRGFHVGVEQLQFCQVEVGPRDQHPSTWTPKVPVGLSLQVLGHHFAILLGSRQLDWW